MNFPAWLGYSASKGGTFCRHCVIYANRHPACGKVGALVVSPLTRYGNAKEAFRAHELILFHKEATAKSDAFIDAIENGKNIIQVGNSAVKRLMEKNRVVLRSIIESIILCRRQNISMQ